MIKTNRILPIFITLLALSTLARADVSFNAGRVAAVDTGAVAEFYKSALGMQEVNRIPFQGGAAEIMLNFGKTEAEAKANKGAQVVIFPRDSDDVTDSVPHLIFNVTDMDATVAAIRKAGGKMQGEPREFGNTGIIIGMGIDPAGNLLELIQQP